MPVYNFQFTDNNKQPDANGLSVAGAYLPIEVHVLDAIAQQLTANNQQVPQPVSGFALIDTGATNTAVHEPIIQQLKLNPHNVANMGTAGGPVQRNIYAVKIDIPGVGLSGVLNNVAGVDLSGQMLPMQPPQAPQQMIALLGRDFLQSTVMVWNGTVGTWSLAC